jgi:hypothetical protein
MKSRKGCVMGTSIHKEKSGEASPVKFLGGLKDSKLGKALNPMGAIMEKTGMADTTLGKVLNPMSLLNRK